MIYAHETGGGFEKKVNHYVLDGPSTYKTASSWRELAEHVNVKVDSVEGYYVIGMLNKLGRQGWELVSVSESPQADLGGNIHHTSERWTLKRTR